MVQIKFVKEIPIINGTYKKYKPNGEIGYQKWRVRKTYEVEIISKDSQSNPNRAAEVASDLILRTISVTSSLTPLIELYSCCTPSI